MKNEPSHPPRNPTRDNTSNTVDNMGFKGSARGKGKGKGAIGQQSQPIEPTTCFICGESGHWRRECPQGFYAQAKGGARQPKPRQTAKFQTGCHTKAVSMGGGEKGPTLKHHFPVPQWRRRPPSPPQIYPTRDAKARERADVLAWRKMKSAPSLVARHT